MRIVDVYRSDCLNGYFQFDIEIGNVVFKKLTLYQTPAKTLAVRIDHGRAAQWIADPDVNALIAAKAWEKFEPIAHASEGEQMSMFGQVRRALAAVTAS